jgi:hypothetical protein
VLQEAEWLRSQVNCFDLLSWEDGIGGLLLFAECVLLVFF